MRIATVVLVCALLCGCGFTKRLFVAQSDPRPVWCPPSVMEPCEGLKPPASASDVDFKAAAADWIQSYKVCKLKQQIIADCVEQHNQALDSTKK